MMRAFAAGKYTASAVWGDAKGCREVMQPILATLRDGMPWDVERLTDTVAAIEALPLTDAQRADAVQRLKAITEERNG